MMPPPKKRSSTAIITADTLSTMSPPTKKKTMTMAHYENSRRSGKTASEAVLSSKFTKTIVQPPPPSQQPVVTLSQKDVDQYQNQQQQDEPSEEGTQQQRLMKPGPFDVICARGKQAYNHPGNVYFRSLVQKATEKYSSVESKLQRSMIVTEIVDAIREKGNGFIRQTKDQDGEYWIECSDVMCREKVGQHFRNALGGMYKSSTKSKRHVKEECVPKIQEDLSKLVLSNRPIRQIVERLSMDVIFVTVDDDFDDNDNNGKNAVEDELSSSVTSSASSAATSAADAAFLDVANRANAKLLQTIKSDESIVKLFQDRCQIGRKALDDAYKMKRNTATASAARKQPRFSNSSSTSSGVVIARAA
jgi:hypothetical protein